MPTRIEDCAIVETEPGQLPVLAVHVLERLGYRVNRHSKRVGEIIAGLQQNEQIGRDWFRSDYQVVLAFRKASSGCLINVEVAERTGGGTSGECQKRCDEIIIKLQADATRAKELALEREKSTIHGSSRWGTEDDLREAGYLTNNPAGTQLIIGRASTGEFIAVPERVSYAHALVVGRTGVGKSTGFFIPNIIERVGVNMIITEATPDYGPGELYTLTAGWRQNAGHEVLSFNPAVMSSTRINPIDRIRNAPEIFKAREAERLADLIITNGERPGTRSDPVFDRSEKHLLLSLLLYMACSDLDHGHFGALRWLMLTGIENILDVMTRCPSEVAQMEFDGWVRDTTDGFRFSVAAGLKTKLNSWLTDQVVALTERTDIDLNTLNEKLWTFYIAVPNRSRDSQLMGSLMFNFLTEHILDQGAKMKYRTALMLDEFTNFGRISNIADFLAIVRKARIGVTLGFQNYYQLEQVYGRTEAKIIFDQPATQIFFQQKKYAEAKELSEALGRVTMEEVSVSDSGRIIESVMGRPLATPDELMRLERQCIAFTNDTHALKLPLIGPEAYSFALSSPPAEKSDHVVSEFILKRGRTSKPVVSEERAHQEEPVELNKEERVVRKAKNKEKTKRREPESATRPDMGDLWS